MGRTFATGDFSVTVEDDRSIRVRSGDWISKYSAAIYGDPMAHWDRYKRKSNGALVNLTDSNKAAGLNNRTSKPTKIAESRQVAVVGLEGGTD